MNHYVFLLNIPPDTGWGGCEQMLMQKFQRIDYQRCRVTLVATKDLFSDILENSKIPVRFLLFPFSMEKKGLRRFTAMFSLLRSLRAQRVVFVHNYFFHFGIADFLAAFFISGSRVYSMEVLAAKKPVEKIFKKYFGVIPNFNLWWYKEMLPITLRGWLSKRIVAISREVKERMVSYYHYPADRIIVAPNGADIRRFRPDPDIRKEARNEMGVPEKDIVIVSMARLSPQKCLHRAINAFDVLSRERSDLWLLFVGDGELRKELEALAASKRSAGHIRFLGHQSKPEVFCQMSDIFILPSDYEGMSGAMLEAMSSGLITVVTRTSGVEEVIEDGENGFIADFSEESIAEAMGKAVGMTPREKKRMAQSARRRIVEHFDIEKNDTLTLQALGISANAKVS